MIQNIATASRATRLRGIELVDEIFGFAHPDYIDATEENIELLRKLDPNSILYEVGDDGELKGWVVSIPTTQEIAEEFIGGKMSENQLLQRTVSTSRYNAVYHCAAGVVEKYRRQGIAFNLRKEALARLPLAEDYEIYAWPISPEGEALTRKLEQETGKVVRIRHAGLQS